MIRDITIGQYYPAPSVIHKLDPRVKLVGTVAFIIMIFCINNLAGYVAATVALACLIRLSKVPLKYILKGLKAIFIILIFTAALNLFLTPERRVVQWKFIRITQEGILMALKMGCAADLSDHRLIHYDPDHNAKPSDRRFGKRPWAVKENPCAVHEIAMIMAIALRFIPILMEETDKIMKAQQARCADFESGKCASESQKPGACACAAVYFLIPPCQ